MHASLALALTGLICYIVGAVFHRASERANSFGGQIFFGLGAVVGFGCFLIGLIWWIWSAVQ